MNQMLVLLWVVPSVTITTWTLLAAAWALMAPLNSRVPTFIGTHLLLWVHNPKDDVLYRRPSPAMVGAALVAGLVPLISLAMLAFQVYMLSLYLVVQRESKR